MKNDFYVPTVRNKQKTRKKRILCGNSRKQEENIDLVEIKILVRNIRIATSVADPGCLSRIRMFSIPDPNFFHPGSRICIKKFKYFNPKNWFLSSQKYDPGCSPRIRILFFYPSQISDPGVKKHRIPDPQH